MLFKRIIFKVSGTLVLILLILKFAGAQVRPDSLSVRLMFYNVENLFDTYDDPLTDDDDFLPDGLMRWNVARYNKKIVSVYKTIIAAGGWQPPAIVGLCEVENKRVLEDLLNKTALSNFGYGIIHEETPDPRGIDVCMIFREDLVKIIDHRSWIPKGIEKTAFRSRSVLYVKCSILSDTLNLIINHWPSRRGGVLSAEPLRIQLAEMIKSAADSLVKTSSRTSKIIILGDFNCDTDDPVIQILTGLSGTGEQLLINISAQRNSGNSGTYRFQGIWETIDQVIVSRNILNSSKGIYTTFDNIQVFKPDFLLKNDINYPGTTPFSTYRGYRYQGGFSDHLPVLLDLGFR